MKNSLAILALIALITFGCRATKQTVSSKNEVKTTANLDVKQTVDNKLTVDSLHTVVDKSVTNLIVREDITVTQLSKPDSVGRQFATQTTVIHRITDNNIQYNTDTQIKLNKQNSNKTALRDKSKYKSDDKSQNVTTKETKTPAWVYVVGLFSLLVAIIGVYTLLKRFGVIK